MNDGKSGVGVGPPTPNFRDLFVGQPIDAFILRFHQHQRLRGVSWRSLGQVSTRSGTAFTCSLLMSSMYPVMKDAKRPSLRKPLSTASMAQRGVRK
jgi:hypothetical protein